MAVDLEVHSPAIDLQLLTLPHVHQLRGRAMPFHVAVSVAVYVAVSVAVYVAVC